MDDVPAITLTDASPAQSPIKDHGNSGFGFGDSIGSRVSPARPETPGSRSGNGHACNDSSSAWPSPGRLIRTLSSNTQQATGGAQKEDVVSSKHDSQPAIDPLSQHILKRTNAPMNPPPSRPRTSDINGGDATRDDQSREHSPAPAVQEPITRTDTIETTNAPTAHKDLKKGVKAVSFLSRLMGSAKKKDAEEEAVDDESTTSEGRPEGNDAEVFAQKIDNMGFNPRHPQPPAYIKVRAKFKKEREFDRLFLAQELQGSRDLATLQRTTSANKLRRKSSATPSGDQTVWAMEFSRDGKYLAAAGADMIVRVWAVLSSAEDRQNHESQESNEYEADGRQHAEHLSAPVFQSKPVREYDGHSSTVLDLSWSKNNFLLSSSMDKTVRLWHVTRPGCLCTFKHNDFVPSISFHPKDDRFFLAGSLDSKLRLWSIPDKSVAYAAQLPDMITAVAFTPDGKFAMAGCLSGLCMFYETEGLKYQTQIHVRSTRGQNAKGSKITGIQAQYGASGDVKVLITSNDSRIRLYNFRDKSLELKFRGNENNCSQIKAKLSDDGRYVVCGSEDRKAYLWSLHQMHGEKRDRTPVEMFEAHNTITTAVCIAPLKTRQHLSRSEDPVYDLCNPPPVTLLSHAERAESQASSRPPTENGSIRTTPPDAEGTFQRPREPASYLTRSSHKEGNILITADYSGKIKVFRQDCSWAKRQRDESDRSSLFGKRGNKPSRTGSLATKASQRSLRDAYASRTSISSQAPSDRILSWRQGINSTSSISERGRNATSKDSKNRDRSVSPRKSLDQRGRKEGNQKPGSIRSTHPLAADSMVRSPSPIDRAPTNEEAEATRRFEESQPADERNPLSLQGDRSYHFWDPKIWKEHAERLHKMTENHEHMPPREASPGHSTDEDREHLGLRPPLAQVPSYVSELSDERSAGESGEEDAFEDAREG